MKTRETKRLKTAPRDADDVGHEYSGSGRGASTAEEVQRSLYGDDAGPVEDIPEEDQQLEAEEPQDLNDKDDGMAHSTLDEEEELVDYAERYMTDEDNRIIQIDIPERMQHCRMEKNLEDRISALPDDILISIVSCLNLSEAARTSIISHRWRYLWTHTTSILDFVQLLTGNATYSMLQGAGL